MAGVRGTVMAGAIGLTKSSRVTQGQNGQRPAWQSHPRGPKNKIASIKGIRVSETSGVAEMTRKAKDQSSEVKGNRMAKTSMVAESSMEAKTSVMAKSSVAAKISMVVETSMVTPAQVPASPC